MTCGLLLECVNERGLADARFTCYEIDLPVTVQCRFKMLVELRERGITAHYIPAGFAGSAGWRERLLVGHLGDELIAPLW